MALDDLKIPEIVGVGFVATCATAILKAFGRWLQRRESLDTHIFTQLKSTAEAEKQLRIEIAAERDRYHKEAADTWRMYYDLLMKYNQQEYELRIARAELEELKENRGDSTE